MPDTPNQRVSVTQAYNDESVIHQILKLKRDKQNKLIAGENITIVGDVISSTGGGSGGGTWGSITGTLSDQRDLQDALDDKADASDLTTLEGRVDDIEDDIGNTSTPGTIIYRITLSETKIDTLEDKMDTAEANISTLQTNLPKKARITATANGTGASYNVRNIIYTQDGVSTNTAQTAKYYKATGSAEDGAMTQKAITDAISSAVAGISLPKSWRDS